MIKVVMIIAVAYMLYRMFESEKRKKKEKEKQEADHLVATGDLKKDPTCGAYVEAESAISVREGDTVHYFCSYDCRDAFLNTQGKELPNAEKHISATAASAQTEDEKA